jgi:ATP-dependent DNA helicase RecG
MSEFPKYLSSPVTDLSGVGPKRAEHLAQLGIQTIGDLLYHFPRGYQDRREFTAIEDAIEGALVTIRATVKSARNLRMRGRNSMAIITLEDGTGEIRATFFGRGYLANSSLRPGVTGIFHGTVETYQGLALKSPEYEVVETDGESGDGSGRIVPIYPLVAQVTQRLLRTLIREALGLVDGALPETLPPDVRKAENLEPLTECIDQLHFPDTPERAELARARLVFEKILTIQLGVLYKRTRRQAKTGITHQINGPLLVALDQQLPFSLTEAQDRATAEILGDMGSSRPMARLLQGDVGCGKTVVAAHAVAAALDGGYQIAFMAPTELLAEQQYQSFLKLFTPLGVSVSLLTGSVRGAAALRREVSAGSVQVLVGTHALFQRETTFRRLGLVVIDEQHRFGVAQRAALSAKGAEPDVLHMTATPIPRSLTMTLYGGMDLSLIDSMPPGRKPVKTRVVPEDKVAECYNYLKEQAAAELQSFIVCPLVEASELRENSTAVEDHYAELSGGALASVRTALLHGRLDAGEKDAIMSRFVAREIDVLFSTTVIEVGIDVSTATTMVIENADQFGLTQLHQLRGRVGRGSAQSYCFLIGKPATKEGKERLRIFCETESGFDLAEADLKLRGPGEVSGFKQAGFDDPHAADWVHDARLLQRARNCAAEILEQDPEMASPDWKAIRHRILAYGDLAL